MAFQNAPFFPNSMDDDSLVSYTGQATDIQQVPQQYHLYGCPNVAFPLAECFQCSTIDFRLSSPSPPPPLPPPPAARESPYVQERSQSKSPRTWAQVVAQGVNTSVAPPPSAPPSLPQVPNRSPPSQRRYYGQQQRTQQGLSRLAPAGYQRASYTTYAQVAQQQAQQTQPVRPGSQYPRTEDHQRALQVVQYAQYNATGGIQASQNQPYGPYRNPNVPQHAARPHYGILPTEHNHQLPLNPTQTFLQAPMQNLNSLLQQEYTNDPRSVERLVNGTERGGHRRSMQDSGLTSPTSPMSPGATSTVSSISQRRRTGSALRDPSLDHRCQACDVTFSKPEDLRRHVHRVHTEITSRPHPCPDCPWRFQHPKDVRRHVASAHEAARRFYCPYRGCGKNYSRADNIPRHIARAHRSPLATDSGLGPSLTSRTPSNASAFSQQSWNA